MRLLKRPSHKEHRRLVAGEWNRKDVANKPSPRRGAIDQPLRVRGHHGFVHRLALIERLRLRASVGDLPPDVGLAFARGAEEDPLPVGRPFWSEVRAVRGEPLKGVIDAVVDPDVTALGVGHAYGDLAPVGREPWVSIVPHISEERLERSVGEGKHQPAGGFAGQVPERSGFRQRGVCRPKSRLPNPILHLYGLSGDALRLQIDGDGHHRAGCRDVEQVPLAHADSRRGRNVEHGDM